MVKSLISVIIPIYKTEKYLRECVDSVLRQTYANWEAILVDDGSPDACPLICDEYAAKDSRIKVIHKTNGGLSDARNAGFEAAAGEYIYFLDSDDYIAEHALEEMFIACENHNADFIFFDGSVILEGEKNYGYGEDRYKNIKSFGKNKGDALYIALYNQQKYIPGVPFCFIKSAHIKKHGLRFYSGIIHEDQLYILLLFIYADLAAHLPKPLYYRRIREDSIMTSLDKIKSFDGYYKTFHELLKLHKNDASDDTMKAITIRIKKMFRACGRTYLKMNKTEKKAVSHTKKELLRVVREKKYFNDFLIRLLHYGWKI